MLINSFEEEPLPNFDQRQSLAKLLGMTPRSVQIWFQNRRQRERDRQGAAAREAEAAESGDGDCSPVRESKGAAPLAAPIPAEFTASGARAQIISAAARRYPARDSRGTAPDPLCHSVCARSSAGAHPALPPSARRRERPGGRRRVVVGVDLLRGRAGRPLLADRGPVGGACRPERRHAVSADREGGGNHASTMIQLCSGLSAAAPLARPLPASRP